MNLIEYAKSELSKIEHDEDGMQNAMDKCVLDLIESLSNQGHSNNTIHYCLNVFNRLTKFKPLTPLTGEDDEWEEISQGVYQNKRHSAVFKENGKAYDIEGKIFSNDGENWYMSKDSIVYIDFPYVVPDSPEKVLLDTKAEKEKGDLKMCKYCKNYFTGDDYQPLVDRRKGLTNLTIYVQNFLDEKGTAVLSTNVSLSDGDGGYIELIPEDKPITIHYCPMCGTELKGVIR